jgi:hypothetical protein
LTILLFENELNGKKIAYSSETVFLIQIGRYYKGSYKTRYTIKGSLPQAVRYYNGINIGRGYKKRLVMPSSPRNRGILARAFSFPTPVKGERWMF